MVVSRREVDGHIAKVSPSWLHPVIIVIRFIPAPSLLPEELAKRIGHTLDLLQPATWIDPPQMEHLPISRTHLESTRGR